MKNERTKKSQTSIEKTTDKLAEEQKINEAEMHHLPTEGKKPGEVEDFKEGVKKNPKNKEKLKEQK